MDMRQKLLPIFLREADSNLGILQHFLQDQQVHCRYDDLEAAFRAAHTLKGTSLLVQANSVNSISRRIEAMLEKHLSIRTNPTRVELEAMQLAVEWLFQLVNSLQEAQPDPQGLVAEALRALDLAECFPGATPLVELLDSDAEHRSPSLDDPFAFDPDLEVDEEGILKSARDPFAEDPDFGFGLDVRGEQPTLMENLADSPSISDPFAEDTGYDTDIAETKVSENQCEADPKDIPFDPFAEDESHFDEWIARDGAASVLAGHDQNVGSSLAPSVAHTDKSSESDTDVDQFPLSASVEEDSFVDGSPLETDAAVEETLQEELENPELSHLESIKGFAESLLLPKPDEQRRVYTCCAFELSGHSYYLPIKYMVEISEQPPLLPLPLAPAVVKGLINLRGQVMPVIDLSVLNGTYSEPEQLRRLVVAEHQGEKLAFLAEGIPQLSEELNGEKIDLAKFITQHRIRGAEA